MLAQIALLAMQSSAPDPLAAPPPPYAAYLPLVPGVVSLDVTQANIGATICSPGYTKTIRPPVRYTTMLKRYQMRQWHMSGAMRDYEEDHRVPLEVGGDFADPDNLYPEAWTGQYGAHVKDALENRVRRLICARAITLQQGQAVFLGDWIAALPYYLSVKP